MSDKCVHTEHCCYEHGCKYGDEDCPVETGRKPQSFLCEYCPESSGSSWRGSVSDQTLVTYEFIEAKDKRIKELEADYQRLFGALAEIIDATDDNFGALDNIYAIARKALGVSDE